jgi:hypothetical protein
LDIYLKNTVREITYKEDIFADARNAKADKGDIIYIKFIIEKLPNIEIVIRVGEIYKYDCGIKEIMKLRAYRGRYDYGFGGSRIDIMDRSYYINKENPSRFFINIRDDIISIDANKVAIEDLKYVN